MIKLLKIEWLKVKNYRAFWILLILYTVAILGTNIIAWSINNRVRETTAGSFVPSLYSYPTTWNMVTYVSTFLFLFPGLLIINHTGNEFTFKTSRQNIIDGWTRKNYISVKLLFAVFISLIATIAVFLTGIILGAVASDGSSHSFTDNLQYIPYFFLQTLLYCLVAVFIVMWVRKSGLAIGIYFAYSLVIENLISGALFWTLKDSGNTKFRQLLPLESSDALIRTPRIQAFLPGQNFSDTALLIIVTAYILFFSWLSYRNFTKKDL
jgi:ABC-2 type transport system permease protein